MSERKAFTLASLKGGPHGLGDPNDTSLRKIEENVLIPQIMRERAKTEKCVQEVKEFSKCCKDASFLMAFKCKAETTALKTCYEKWFTDPHFKEECTQVYLKERNEYRRTGVVKKLRTKAASVSM